MLERPQEHRSRFHSEFPEQSRNSLKDPVQERSEHLQRNKDHQSGVHSKFREASRHSLGTLNVGRSRVQAASCVDLQQVPLTWYEQYQQEIQAYPIAREPVNVQPMATNNNSALLDLPNVQTDLPTPLIWEIWGSGQGGVKAHTQEGVWPGPHLGGGVSRSRPRGDVSQHALSQTPPSRQLLLLAVQILLECILVYTCLCVCIMISQKKGSFTFEICQKKI